MGSVSDIITADVISHICSIMIEIEKRELQRLHYMYSPSEDYPHAIYVGTEDCRVIICRLRRDHQGWTFIAPSMTVKFVCIGELIEKIVSDGQRLVQGDLIHDLIEILDNELKIQPLCHICWKKPPLMIRARSTGGDTKVVANLPLEIFPFMHLVAKSVALKTFMRVSSITTIKPKYRFLNLDDKIVLRNSYMQAPIAHLLYNQDHDALEMRTYTASCYFQDKQQARSLFELSDFNPLIAEVVYEHTCSMLSICESFAHIR